MLKNWKTTADLSWITSGCLHKHVLLIIISTTVHRWARGGVGFYPVWKNLYDPPLRFKMTPTPSEMAFDPLLDFELATFFFRKDIKNWPRKKKFRRKKFLWPPSKIQNDPHPLRNGFWPPVRFWAGDFFFWKDIKKFAQKKKFRRLTPAPALGQRGPKQP